MGGLGDSKGKLVLKIYNFGKRHKFKKGPYHKLCMGVYTLLNWVIVVGMFNTELHVTKDIGNINLYHPYGVIIHMSSVLKDGVTVRQQVTIGNKGGSDDSHECPIIEENVDIGAGAKIIGNVRIGKNSKIGANAVVTKSFPENSILVGVPARDISKRDKK